MSRFENTKLYDIAAAAPLIALYGWSIARDWPRLSERLAMLGAGGAGLEPAAEALALFLAVVFAGLLIALVFVRVLPVKKSSGLVPRAVAVAGAAGSVILIALPPAFLPAWLDVLSLALVVAGLAGAVAALLYLSRSFSVLPEARALIVRGPYARIRHPVYLSEAVALCGIALQFAQPWAALIAAALLACQFARMGYEERVLSDAFPEYAAYAARTARLIPGLY